MRTRLVLFTSVLGFTAAQRGTAQNRLSKPVIDTLPHGVVRVRNTGPSQWVGTSGWKLVLERTITADGSPALIAEPRTLAVDTRGNVFETDWKVDGIQEFDRSGKFVRQLGRKGDGPGEFQVPIDIAIRGDTLLAYASNQSRISLWRTDGKLLKEWHVNFCCGGDPQFGAQGSAMVTVQLHSNGVTRNGAIRWHADGSMLDTIFLPIEPTPHVWETAHGTFPIPFSAYHVGTFNSRGSYISGFASRYSLVVARRGSDSVRIIELPGTRAPIATDLADSVFARYAKIPALVGIAKRGDLPPEQPYFNRLHNDEHDNIWIERVGPDGHTASFDVVNLDGAYLGSVAMPAKTPRALLFVNGRLYATTDTADGEVVIQVYRIDKGGK